MTNIHNPVISVGQANGIPSFPCDPATYILSGTLITTWVPSEYGLICVVFRVCV